MFIENCKSLTTRVALIALLITGLLGVQPAKAETDNFGWAQGGGGPNLDYGTALAADDSGNVYATGFVTNGPGNQDIFIHKRDSNGNLTWSKIIAGPSNDTSYGIALDGNGNVYVAGSYSMTVDFDENHPGGEITSVGLTDAFVVKYDGNGSFVWIKSVGWPSADSGNDVAIDGSGNVYLIGNYSQILGFQSSANTSFLNSAGLTDVFVSKFDNNGNSLWTKSVGGPSDDQVYDIAIDPNGNILFTGYFSGTADFDPGIGIETRISAGEFDVFLCELDSDGNFNWVQSMGGSAYDNGIELALDQSGNIYLTGYFSNTIFTETIHLVSAGAYDIFVAKLDNKGSFLWVKGMGGASSDSAFGIALDDSDNLYITGDFSETVDFNPGAGTSNLTSAGADDIFIDKLDGGGNFIWAKNLGGTSMDAGDGIAVDGSGNLYLTGYFSETVDFDPGAGTSNLTSEGNTDVFLSKLSFTPQTYYVKWNAMGMNNGTSWANAFTNLQSALALASSGDEIWVAEGTYKPTTSTDRTVSFMLSTGTKVYGGFAGTESLLAQRSTGANVTVLSGDIGLLGENSDNSYHVLTTSNTDTHTILDGFTIIEGNANNISAVYGGGIYNDRGNPTIRNVSIRDNQAMAGGGMYNLGNPTLMNVTFSNNRAPTGLGGGIYNLGRSGPTLANVTFHANIAAGGGGMYNTGSSPTLINVTFTGNQGTQHGGGIFNYSDSRPTLINVILWGDSSEIYNDNGTSTPMISYSVVAGSGGSGGAWNTALGIDGGNNLDVDPLMGFLAENGGFTKTIALLPGSPAIDTGDDANCAATDQRGVTRPQGSHCDIGAYEAEYRPAISGNTGAAGVALSYIDGTSKSITSDGNGNYSISLPVGWAGVVTPNKTGYTFTPANRTYSNLQSDQTSQNYTIQPTTGGADTTGVFRPNNGALYLKNKNETGYADVQINYGIGGDYPVVGDWDGNGTVTIGIYRNGGFYLRNSNTIGFADVVFAFGAPGDQPVAGDWDGDGVDTIGVYRNGMFFLRNQNNSGAPSAIFGLGIPGDVGIAGDWNGDGIDTTGVFRPSNGALYLKNQNTTGFANIQINYGIAGDKPVTGDWDNDGVDTIGVYRNGQFMLRNSNTIGFADIVFALGIPGDVPIAGNWDGLP